MPRLFFGIDIPDPVRQQLSLYQGGLAGARWIDAQNYHITLRFIGDVEPYHAAEIIETCSYIHRTQITIELNELRAFGSNKPRALIISVQPSQELKRLQNEIEQRLQRLGVAPQHRKFTPHVTLARLRDVPPFALAEFLNTRSYFQPLTFTAASFELFSSRNSKGGGPYLIEESYPLFPNMKVA